MSISEFAYISWQSTGQEMLTQKKICSESQSSIKKKKIHSGSVMIGNPWVELSEAYIASLNNKHALHHGLRVRSLTISHIYFVCLQHNFVRLFCLFWGVISLIITKCCKFERRLEFLLRNVKSSVILLFTPTETDGCKFTSWCTSLAWLLMYTVR